MTRLRKLFITAVAAAVLCAALFLVACGSSELRDHDYKEEDLSSYSSAQLEATADYGAFFRPKSGDIGDVSVYFENGVYYLFYVKEGEGYESHPIYLAETSDFTSYTERGKMLSAGGLYGESMLGVCSVTDYAGDKYMFYTGSNDGVGHTLRVAVSDDGFETFKRKSDFILRAEEYGFAGGFIDADVRYYEELDRFVCLASTYHNRKATLALFFFDPTLNTEYIEYAGTLYTDSYGFTALRSPSLFELDGEWYITYCAVDDSLTGKTGDVENTDMTLTGASGKTYYIHAPEMVGPYKAEYQSALDSAVFKGGKVAIGNETVLIGRTLGRSGNEGYAYGAGANMRAHVITANADKTLSLSYPQAYTDRFDGSVPLVKKSSLTLTGEDADGTPAVIAKEARSYRLSANIKFTENTKRLGFVFGHGGADVSVAIDPALGIVAASCGGGDIAVQHIGLTAGKVYRADVFAEGSDYVMYIDGVAFSFRARNTGNKSIAAFAVGGTVDITDVTLLAVGNRSVFNGSVVLEVGESKQVAVTAKNDSYISATASIYAEKNVTVSLVMGETEKKVSGSGIICFEEYVPAAAGETATLSVTAGEAAVVYGDMKLVETHLIPESKEIENRTRSDRSSSLTAPKAGYYKIEAIAVQDEPSKAKLVIECDGADVASIALSDGFARAVCALYADANSVITARVDHTGAAVGYKVRLSISDSEKIESNLKPSGSVLRSAYSLGVAIGDHEDDADAVASFGAQGTDGFVYTYGRSAERMIALESYSSGLSQYTTPTSDKVSHRAGRLTAGGGYLSGVTYVAAAQGRLRLELGVTPTSGDVIVRLYQNNIRLCERVLTAGSGTADIAVTAAVRAGDRLVFAAEHVGGGETSTADYTYIISKVTGDERVKVADLYDDFYLKYALGERWLYGYSYNFDFDQYTFEFTRYSVSVGESWTHAAVPGVEIKRDLVINDNNDYRFATVGYTFDTSGKHEVVIDFDGTDNSTRIIARVVVKDIYGNITVKEFLGDGLNAADWTVTKEINVNAGDTIYVVLSREAASWAQGRLDIDITLVG